MLLLVAEAPLYPTALERLSWLVEVHVQFLVDHLHFLDVPAISREFQLYGSLGSHALGSKFLGCLGRRESLLFK